MGETLGSLTKVSAYVENIYSSVGTGFFLDAGLRVFFAYTISPDTLPALTTAMYIGTNVALIIISNAYYISCGIFNPHSSLFATESG